MSFGGYVAFEYCRRHEPGRVRGLVLLDTRAQADTAAHARARIAGAQRVLREGSHVLGGRAEETDSGLWGRSAPEEMRDDADRVMRSRPAAAAAAAMCAMAARPDSFDTLRALRVPVLVIVGEEDGIAPVTDSVQMATVAAESGAAEPTLVVVPQAAHMAAVEQPDAVADAISAYLRRLLSSDHGR
jgi:pimeloyl-ACP methyl ester carboxylesterase